MFEKIRILRRPVNQEVFDCLLQNDIDPFLAKIIAARPIPEHEKQVMGVFNGRLADLSSPFLLKDIDLAVARIREAILKSQHIAIETDHDCDGQTSHAVLVRALVDILGYPADHVHSFIGHRMQEGYGLSDALAERILQHEPKIDLVITADNGSSDEVRIARLKAAGVDVIVTDHHGIPVEGIPASACACLNPTREDCDFPDPYIAGCMVAWLLMAATRRSLVDAGDLPATTPSMTDLLDFVAVGTVADCVSMARSLNNRVVVQYGLQKINQFARPCWQALRPLLKNVQVTPEDLGFLIGPLLNSDGRLSDALGSVSFLLAPDLESASRWVENLFQQNQERKRIQQELVSDALHQAEHQVMSGRSSIVVYLEEGHAGVHGIAASRIKDQFGRPVVIFSPKQNDALHITGSCRSIDALHIRETLQQIAEQYPDLIQKFGGHKAAAGLSIPLERFEEFSLAFESQVAENLAEHSVGPVIWTDGLWEGGFDVKRLQALQSLQPYGREFDEPIFESYAYVKNMRRFGKSYNHLEILLHFPGGEQVKAIWFGACQAGELPIQEQNRLHLVFSLPLYSHSSKGLELNIKYAQPVAV
jgi:single-stranded-DNA-specific exonuclease